MAAVHETATSSVPGGIGGPPVVLKRGVVPSTLPNKTVEVASWWAPFAGFDVNGAVGLVVTGTLFSSGS